MQNFGIISIELCARFWKKRDPCQCLWGRAVGARSTTTITMYFILYNAYTNMIHVYIAEMYVQSCMHVYIYGRERFYEIQLPDVMPSLKVQVICIYIHIKREEKCSESRDKKKEASIFVRLVPNRCLDVNLEGIGTRSTKKYSSNKSCQKIFQSWFVFWQELSLQAALRICIFFVFVIVHQINLVGSR